LGISATEGHLLALKSPVARSKKAVQNWTSACAISTVDSLLFSYYDIIMKETIDKKRVTEEQIAAWVDEAEKGYDVNVLKKRGRGRPGRGAAPSQVIAVRLTPEELKQIDQKAAELNMTRSEYIRHSLTA
jgi:hypothetical protein